MQHKHLTRRRFLQDAATQSAAAVLAATGVGAALGAPASAAPAWRGPKAILVRFGGGVRRRETIVPAHSYAPFLCRDFAPRGTLLRQVEIGVVPDGAGRASDTSHGQGTLNLLTGRYGAYRNTHPGLLGERFEAEVPTLFECLRRRSGARPHETLMINGEDRLDEEFYSFSNHPDYGRRYRSQVLSAYRLRCHILRRQIAEGRGDEAGETQRELARLEALDSRDPGRGGQGGEIAAFWDRWIERYGESGLRQPRGDRLLTELALRAMDTLRPRLLLINYNDPDYVHWGYPEHYTRGIAVIDDGLRRIVEAVARDPFYRRDTVIAVAPDCGRDDNRAMRVPYQHHFNSRSSREIFACFAGPGVARGRVVDRPVEQIAVAPTLAALLGIPFPHGEAEALPEVFA